MVHLCLGCQPFQSLRRARDSREGVNAKENLFQRVSAAETPREKPGEMAVVILWQVFPALMIIVFHPCSDLLPPLLPLPQALIPSGSDTIFSYGLHSLAIPLPQTMSSLAEVRRHVRRGMYLFKDKQAFLSSGGGSSCLQTTCSWPYLHISLLLFLQYARTHAHTHAHTLTAHSSHILLLLLLLPVRPCEVLPNSSILLSPRLFLCWPALPATSDCHAAELL